MTSLSVQLFTVPTIVSYFITDPVLLLLQLLELMEYGKVTPVIKQGITV